MLPQIRACLGRLKALRKRIVGLQAKVDIEELTAPSPSRDRGNIELMLREIEADVHAFHKASEEINSLGCELKDLDKGLIDFYGMRGPDVVYYCWKEGEDSISHWHTLDSGFQGRQKIEE